VRRRFFPVELSAVVVCCYGFARFGWLGSCTQLRGSSLSNDNTSMTGASSSGDISQHCYPFKKLALERLVPHDDSQCVRRACSRTQLIHSKSCMCLQHITPGLFEQHCKLVFSSVGPKVLNADSQSIRMGLVRNKYRVLRDVTLDS
jgi:hypothetical protein